MLTNDEGDFKNEIKSRQDNVFIQSKVTILIVPQKASQSVQYNTECLAFLL